jgi:hypothetical protein
MMVMHSSKTDPYTNTKNINNADNDTNADDDHYSSEPRNMATAITTTIAIQTTPEITIAMHSEAFSARDVTKPYGAVISVATNPMNS